MKLRFVSMLPQRIQPQAWRAYSGSVIASRGMRRGDPAAFAPRLVSRLLDCFGAGAPRNDDGVRSRPAGFQTALALLCILPVLLSAFPSTAGAAPVGLQTFASQAPGGQLLLEDRLRLRLGLSLPAGAGIPPSALSFGAGHDPQQLRAREHLFRHVAASLSLPASGACLLQRRPMPVRLRRLSLHREMRDALLDTASQAGLLRPWLPVLPRAGARRGGGKGRVEGRGRMAAPQRRLDVRKENGVRAAELCAGL